MREIAKSLLFRGNGSTVIYECRRCGMGVSSPDAACSQCGTDEIVEYTID